jgi:hypothetical protein
VGAKIPRGVARHELLSVVLSYGFVLARSTFEEYEDDRDLLNR